MDSSVVNAELRRQVRPVLKAAGFTRFTERNAWRYSDGRIDVVNFQSFNSYLAEGIGSTTYSFSVNLGCAFTRLPSRTAFKIRGGQPVPAEHECDVRRHLQKTLEQRELPRPDVWYVDERGVYLMPAVLDATHALVNQGLPWFERFASYEELLRTLLEDGESMEIAWGFGNQPSPIRAFLTGYTALALGRRAMAREYLAWLVARGGTLVTDDVRADLAALSPDAPAA